MSSNVINRVREGRCLLTVSGLDEWDAEDRAIAQALEGQGYRGSAKVGEVRLIGVETYRVEVFTKTTVPEVKR